LDVRDAIQRDRTCAIAPLSGVSHADSAPYVAGLAPWERPAQAPRITAATPPSPKVALHGVQEPVPASLKFLDHQGGWYNPFIQPGMPGPYDLRGWHSIPPSSRQNKK